jgi:hypothetical protein
MFEKPKYIVPEGIAHCFLTGGEPSKTVYGPGEHNCNFRHKPLYIVSTKPHLEHATAKIGNIQNVGSTTPIKASCLFYFVQEIIDPVKYFNCNAPVFCVQTGEEDESLDGEEYVYDICELMIFKKLNSLTLQEMTPSIDVEIDITNEEYFQEHYQQMIENAGVRITQLHVLIYGVEQEREGE